MFEEQENGLRRNGFSRAEGRRQPAQDLVRRMDRGESAKGADGPKQLLGQIGLHNRPQRHKQGDQDHPGERRKPSYYK